MRAPRRSLTLALLCLVALLGIGPPAAAAPEDGGLRWSLATPDNEHGEGRPNYGYTLEPGESVEDALVVQNTGEKELTLGVTTADGYTTPAGRLDLHPADVPVEGLGAWVEPETDEITLAPGQSREIAFTLTVPEGTPPGDHTGGIVTVHRTDDGTNIEMDRRFALRIHVRVPGDQVVDLAVSDVELAIRPSWNPFSPTTAVVTYTVRNEGTVRTFYDERLAVSGPAGLGGRGHEELVEEILPGGEVRREVEVEGVWPLVRAGLDIRLQPEAVDGDLGEPVERHAAAWAVPWTLILLLVLVLASAVLIGLRRARERPAPAAESAPAPSSAPE